MGLISKLGMFEACLNDSFGWVHEWGGVETPDGVITAYGESCYFGESELELKVSYDPVTHITEWVVLVLTGGGSGEDGLEVGVLCRKQTSSRTDEEKRWVNLGWLRKEVTEFQEYWNGQFKTLNLTDSSI